MQFRNKNIVLGLMAFLILPFVLTGCLKKVEHVDDLTNNIFDRDYTGEQWYIIEDIAQVSNDLGQIKARLHVTIPAEKVPELNPSSIIVHVSGDGLPVTTIDFPLVPGGDFKAIIDLPFVGAGNYCIELGIYVKEEDAAINLFTDCRTL